MEIPLNDPLLDENNDQNEYERYKQRTENADAAEPRFSVFDGEWILRSCLFKAHSSELHTFRSQGILLSPISNENSKAQILDIIRQVTLALQLRLDWRTLPEDWLAAENAIFPTANHVSLYIPLRDAVLAGSDGDGFSDFHIEPLNVGSATHRIYPRCVTVAGLKIPSLSAGKVLSYGINIFVQFLPRHWRLDHLTEALVFRNLPFDTKGDLTRLLLHYLEEFLSVKLQPLNLALNYTLLIIPVLTQSKRIEALGLIVLPPLLPGVNLTHLARLHALVGLQDVLPVLLSLGWTQLLMGTTRGEVLNPVHLAQLPSSVPLEMRITGLESGITLSSVLTALWTDSSFSPHFFDHIGAAFIARSALYQRQPDFFVDTVSRSHGAGDTLHLILTTPDSAKVTIRPTIGRELRTLAGTTPNGLFAIPDYACLSPHPIDLYVSLAGTHRAVQPRKPSVRPGRDGRARTGVRAGSSSRSRGASAGSSSSTKLLLVDADIPSRYRAMVLSQPLMSEVIPAGPPPLSPIGYFISSLDFLPQPCVLPWTARMTKWTDSTTSSTGRTKEGMFRSPVLPVVLVCPDERSAQAEWFLYDHGSGGRQRSGAAVRLCSWLASKLRGWIRSLTDSLVMINLLNYDVFHGTLDDAVTSLKPESVHPTVPQLPAPPLTADTADDLSDYLHYRDRVLNSTPAHICRGRGSTCHSIPPSFDLSCPVGGMLSATPDFTQSMCPSLKNTSLQRLCTTTTDTLDYLAYRAHVLRDCSVDVLPSRPAGSSVPVLHSQCSVEVPPSQDAGLSVPIQHLITAPTPSGHVHDSLPRPLAVLEGVTTPSPSAAQTPIKRAFSHRLGFRSCTGFDENFLPMLLGFVFHRFASHRRIVPGFIRSRVLARSPVYNRLDSRLIVRRLQDLHYSTWSFRPPSCQDVRSARRPPHAPPVRSRHLCV